MNDPRQNACRQDKSDSLYRYIMDTYESVRRGPWYLRPAVMVREQIEDRAASGGKDADA
jgi:hypothetical protein